MTFVPSARADDAAAVRMFSQANDAYEAGMQRLAEKDYPAAVEQFARSAELYETIIAGGFVSGQVYYNLGNAYYRQQKLGPAILNYRRAERLLPRDDDLQQNLLYARRELVDEQPEPALPEFFRSMLFWHFDTTLNESILIALGLYTAAAALVIIFIFTRRRAVRHLIVVAAVLLAAVVASVGWKYYDQEMVERGIVIAPACAVRAGHADFEPLITTLHEGTEFVIEDRTSTRSAQAAATWLKISVGNTRGWLLADDIAEM